MNVEIKLEIPLGANINELIYWLSVNIPKDKWAITYSSPTTIFSSGYPNVLSSSILIATVTFYGEDSRSNAILFKLVNDL